MANRPIIMTDTTDRILPLAWGVAGGDITADKVNVANSVINSNVANISVNNISLNGANTVLNTSALDVTVNTNANIISNANIKIQSNLIDLQTANITFTANNQSITGDKLDISISNTISINNANIISNSNIKVESNANLSLTSANGIITIGSNDTVNIGATNRIDIASSSGNISLSASNLSVSVTNNVFQGNNMSFSYGDTIINGINTTVNITRGVDVLIPNVNIIANGIVTTNATTIKTTANINHISRLNNTYNAETVANTYNYNQLKDTITFSNSLFNGEIAGANTNIVGHSKLTGTIDSDELVFSKVQKLSDTPTLTFSATESNFSTNGFTTGILNQIISVPITSYIDVTQLASGSVLEAYIQCDSTYSLPGCFYLELYNTTDSISLGYILMSTESAIDSTSTTTKKYRRMIKASTITSILSFMDSSKSYAFRFYVDTNIWSSTSTNITATVNIIEPISVTGGGGGVDNTNLYMPYNSLSTYEVGDVVYQSNYIYECNTAVNSPEAFDPNKWVQTSVTSEFSKLIKYMNSLQILDNVQF